MGYARVLHLLPRILTITLQMPAWSIARDRWTLPFPWPTGWIWASYKNPGESSPSLVVDFQH